MTIGRIRWEMSLIWSDNWKRWQVSNIRLNGIIFSKETGDTHWTTNCLHVKACVSYLFTHWFYFIEIGKKIHACGHDFEEVMHAYDNWKNPMTGDTHWTKKKPIEKQRRIEYKSDNIVVRHSFFENKMCDVRDNPRWALSHVDDMLDILENHADECAKDNLTSSWKKQWNNSFKA